MDLSANSYRMKLSLHAYDVERRRASLHIERDVSVIIFADHGHDTIPTSSPLFSHLITFLVSDWQQFLRNSSNLTMHYFLPIKILSNFCLAIGRLVHIHQTKSLRIKTHLYPRSDMARLMIRSKMKEKHKGGLRNNKLMRKLWISCLSNFNFQRYIIRLFTLSLR